MNRLASEASAYLLQHARNPVAWYPWGEEALAEARRRDVPILLSIGYSACHWCHVMERESFEDPAIAALMNERFVNVKVDREERPDLDQIYQLVVQLMGRNGGWPLTVFLTPSQRPFFGGTYFPPEDRYGMPGFPKLLVALSDAYRDERDAIEGQATELTEAIARAARGARSETPEAEAVSPELLEEASRFLLARFDEAHGGFGRRPKFPNTMALEVLLRRGVLEGDGVAKDAVRLALEQMEKGGIRDHLGGGFHRYSTDERWLVPHFEKMLYDNALLLRLYADGHRVFGAFEETALSIADYVAREMTDASGGFHASQDADSEGEEGKFFVWDEADVRAALPDDDLAARVALTAFGVTAEGNFEDHGRPTGKTVLHEAMPVGAVAARLGIAPAEAREAFARAKTRMFAAREARPRPFQDPKVLTSWNALFVSALAEASGAFGRAELAAAAERALGILEQRLVTRAADGRLLRVERLFVRDLVKGPGFLDDHAYLANAALDLYELGGDPARALFAREIVDVLLEAFHDEEHGFFFTPKEGESLITRPQDPYDNAVPSGASMACRALARLGTLVDARYSAIAERELLRLAPLATRNALGHGQLVCELDRLVRGSVDVVLVGPRDHEATRALAREVLVRWIPNRTLAWVDPSEPRSLVAAAALAEGKPAADRPVAYVCRGRTCSLPVGDPAALGALLDG